MSTHLAIDTTWYELSDDDEQRVASLADRWFDDHSEQMWEFARKHLGGTLSGVPGPFDALLHEIAARFFVFTTRELEDRRVEFYAHWDDERGNGGAERQHKFQRMNTELRFGVVLP